MVNIRSPRLKTILIVVVGIAIAAIAYLLTLMRLGRWVLMFHCCCMRAARSARESPAAGRRSINNCRNKMPFRSALSSASGHLTLLFNSFRGAISILDLLDAQHAALVAEESATNTVFDFLIDLMNLQRSLGGFDFFLDARGLDNWLGRLQHYISGAGR